MSMPKGVAEKFHQEAKRLTDAHQGFIFIAIDAHGEAGITAHIDIPNAALCSVFIHELTQQMLRQRRTQINLDPSAN